MNHWNGDADRERMGGRYYRREYNNDEPWPDYPWDRVDDWSLRRLGEYAWKNGERDPDND